MMKILVVDDQEEIIAVLVLGLNHAGHEVTVVKTIDEARIKLRDNDYDLVITDMNIEETCNGFGVIGLARGFNKQQRIIAMSGDHKLRKEVEKFGVSFLPKPFTINELFSMV